MIVPASQSLLQAALDLHQRGLDQGRSGNMSLRTARGLQITASGARLDRLSDEDLVETDLDGRWSGSVKPSSELSFHCAVYRARADINAIVHVHSPWATSLACMRRPIPAFHYMVAAAGGTDIPCIPYATFGTETLADSVVEGLRERNACLMANHGQIAVARDPDAALELAGEVEHLARCYGQILATGEQPVLLDDEEMARVVSRFRGYGQRQRD